MYSLKNIIIICMTILVSIKQNTCSINQNDPKNNSNNKNNIISINKNIIINPSDRIYRQRQRVRDVHLEQQQFQQQQQQHQQQQHNVHRYESYSAEVASTEVARTPMEMVDVQNTEFDAKTWFCLDTFLSTHNRSNTTGSKAPTNSIDCKCLMNFHCDNKLKLWFRCIEFDDPKWLESIVSILADDLYIKYLLKRTTNQQNCTNNLLESAYSPDVSFDFIQTSNDSVSLVFESIQRLNSMNHVSLTRLQLPNNSLKSIPTDLFKNLTKLLHLNLTQNQLSEFDSGTIFSVDSNLLTLDLSHNHLKHIDLRTLSSLIFVDLSSNSFTNIVLNVLNDNLWSQSINSVQLSDNPWNCSQDLQWLIDRFYKESERIKIPEPECIEPVEARMLTFSLWKSIQLTKLCHNCSCTLRDKYARYGKHYVTVNCTGIGLTSMPTELPKNTKIVDVSNNRIRSLSNIVGVRGWNQITNLYIQNNSLETLEGFEELSSAAMIDFSGNLITEIPKFIITKMNSTAGKPMKLDKIRMGNNPYSCDCVSLSSVDWIKNNYVKIADLNDVRCGDLRDGLWKNESLVLTIDDKFKNRPLIQLQKSQLCPTSHLSLGLYETLNIFMAFSIVIILIKLVYDYFWQKRTGKLPKFFKLNV